MEAGALFDNEVLYQSPRTYGKTVRQYPVFTKKTNVWRQVNGFLRQEEAKEDGFKSQLGRILISIFEQTKDVKINPLLLLLLLTSELAL